MINSVRRGCANIPQRWIFALMCFLAVFNAFSMRGCLSIAITEMVVSTTTTTTTEESITDDTCPSLNEKSHNSSSNGANVAGDGVKNFKGTYEWSEYTQGLILSSFYWGYVITHIPGGMIAEKYGGKHTLGIGILLTSVFTLMTPVAVYIGDSTALIILRILMGLGEGTTYPAINVLLAQWVPPQERSRTASFVYAGALIGTIFTTAVSGWILQYSDAGWPLVFYVMGTLSLVWFMIWLVTCFNNPRDHPFISQKEVEYLNERMNGHTHEKPAPVPWRHILRSKPLWAVIIALIGFNWSILTLITDLPKYMSGVLKLSVENNGYVSSLVYLFMWIGGNTSSWLADHLINTNKLSMTQVRKFGSVTALSVSAVFVLASSYAGCDFVLVVGLLVVALTVMGTAYPSVMVNPLDLSPNYAGTLMALTNGLSALTGIVSPYIIGVLTPNQTLKEWRLVYWILFGVSIVSNLVFLGYGSGDIQYWNDPEFVMEEINQKKRNRTETSRDN